MAFHLLDCQERSFFIKTFMEPIFNNIASLELASDNPGQNAVKDASLEVPASDTVGAFACGFGLPFLDSCFFNCLYCSFNY